MKRLFKHPYLRLSLTAFIFLLCGCGITTRRAALLEEFNGLRKQLEVSTQTLMEKNEEIRAKLVAQIEEQGAMAGGNWKAEQLDLLSQVEKSRAYTHDELSNLRAELRRIGEWDSQTNELENMGEEEENGRLWAGPNEGANAGRGNGQAIHLRQVLNEYANWANKFAEDHLGGVDTFPPIATDPVTQQAAATPGKQDPSTWEYATFHDKPVVGDLAILEKLKAEVEEIHRELLVGLQAKMTYWQMTDGTLKLESTSPVSGNSGTYTSTIKVPRPDGTIAELPVSMEFKPRRPEVVMTPKTDKLKRGKENTFTIEVPSLGENYHPQYKVTGAKLSHPKGQKNRITLVPTAETCTLVVQSLTYDQLITIDEIKFTVVDE